jgi:putative intracellular protease/amidase
MAPTYNVAVLLYPFADILDFSGPIEVYTCNPPAPTPCPFKITTFAQCNPVHGKNNALVYIPDKTLAQVRDELYQYDILVIPGGPAKLLMQMTSTEQGKELLDLIQRFTEIPPRSETGTRIIQSVCTGSLLLAAAGILANRTVTGDHQNYEPIKEFADLAAGGDSGVNVVKKRWVDAGKTDAGVTIVTAGGVSSGIDASFWIMEQLVGTELTEWVAEVMEFERRGEAEAWGIGKA